MDSLKQDTISRIYRWAPIAIALIVLIVSCINLYLNLPIPNLEVGMFPIRGTIYSNIIEINGTNSTALNIPAPPADYNFTFQVYNSGKGVASNVNASLMGEPPETFKVISTYVFDRDRSMSSNAIAR